MVDNSEQYDCQNCGGNLVRIPDSYTFYPHGFCYGCRSCGFKVHPDAVDEEPCELLGHDKQKKNRFIPWRETITVCTRNGCNLQEV